MSSKKQEAQDARTRILEAALNLFSKNGFHATTTRKIANKAEVNEVTLFRLFKSKMILFQEILQLVRRAGFDVKRLEGLSLSPEDLIRYFVKTTLETIDSHSREFRLLHHALLDEVEGFEEEFIEKDASVMQKLLSQAFSMLQKQKKVSSRKAPDILAGLLLSQATGVANERVVRKLSPLRQLDIDFLCESIVGLYLK